MGRRNYASAGPWEAAIGYSRVVVVGPHVYVAGTTATGEDGAVVAPDDAYRQALQCFRNVEASLALAGASLADVVRTRMYLTDIGDAQDVGRAHHRFFSEVRPVATLVAVDALILPEMRLEVEADAYVLHPQ